MILYDIHTHRIKHSTNNYNVVSILNTSPKEYLQEKSIADTDYYSCGIHPWHAEHATDQIEILSRIIEDPKIIAIGEVGLDKLQGSDLSIQKDTFSRQIKLAEESGKPLIIHCVKAWEQLIHLYKESASDIPWIIHGYRGNVEQTKQLIRLGFKFSVGERFNADAVKIIPKESLFCETDDSDVSICKVYAAVSAIRGVEFDQFAHDLAENVQKKLQLFDKIIITYLLFDYFYKINNSSII